MRILFFNRWVGVHVGGTEVHIRELAKHLAEAGHTIEVLTTQGNMLKPYENFFKVRYVWRNPKESRFSRSLTKDPWLGLHALTFSFLSFFKILSLSKRGRRYDVVSVHCTLEALVMMFARLLLRLPFVFVLEGYTFAEGRVAKFADYKISISRSIARQCEARHGYSPRLIPVGVDPDRFHGNGDPLRAKYLVGKGRLILTICRLDPRKDLPTLIHAAKILCNENLHLRFLIVGDGVERASLEQLVKVLALEDVVKIIPEMPASPNYYAACDLFVLPSLYEGFGIVFLEAMSAGLPIVSTTAPAIPEAVGDCGVLVPPRRPDLLAAAIEKVLCDDQLRAKLVGRGRERANRYVWKKLIPGYESAYDSVRTHTLN